MACLHKAKRLQEAGWRIGSAYDFLEMTDEEASYVELKLVLSAAVRKLRHERHLRQEQLAKMVRSSQSRVAGGWRREKDSRPML